MRRLARLSAAGLTGVAIKAAPLPSAVGDPCPDVEVIFARSTGGAGLGDVGQSFVDGVRARAGGRSVAVYSVNYPASFDFANSAPIGAADAANRVQWMATNCPATKLVLSGLSQGAGVIALITTDPHPIGGFTPVPMPPAVANHVAAVAVFGNPADTMRGGGPLTAISSTYGPNAIDLCAPHDLYCFPGGQSFLAHLAYVQNGMVHQAADFVAARLG